MGKEKPFSDEINLIDVLQILRARKLLIVIVTLLVTISAGIAATILPKVYLVSAIIEPAKGVNGRPVEKSEIIKEDILSGIYNQRIRESLKLSSGDLPKLRVFIPKKMTSIHISAQSEKPEIAASFLREMISLVAQDVEKKLKPEKKLYQNLRLLAEMKRDLSSAQIEFMNKHIAKITQQMQSIEKDKQTTLSTLKADPVATLMYLSSIDQKQIDLINLQLDLNTENMQFRFSTVEVENAELELSKIHEMEILKQPVVPQKPFKPKKVAIIGLALMLGFVGSSLLVFLLEFIRQKKSVVDP